MMRKIWMIYILGFMPGLAWCFPFQEGQPEMDTLSFKSLSKSRLNFILDDFYISGGLTLSGVYYSNHFRDLSAQPGYIAGMGQYLPVSGKVMIGAGIQVAERNFRHHVSGNAVSFRNLYLDLPLTAAFELPVLRANDFRLFLGINGSYRVLSQQDGEYAEQPLTAGPVFQYSPDDFSRFDFGWLFGLSMEVRSFMLRAKSYSGFLKLDPKDPGMIYSFQFELGYFLFRKTNRRT